MADSGWIQKTPSIEGKFEVLCILRQYLKKEKTGPSTNVELANVINAMFNGLPEEKLQEKMNK